MYMERPLYQNIVFGILSWHKFVGTKTVYRTEVSKAFFDQGVITVDHRQDVIGSDLSDMMEEFTKQFGGALLKDYDANGNVVKGSVRIEF